MLLSTFNLLEPAFYQSNYWLFSCSKQEWLISYGIPRDISQPFLEQLCCTLKESMKERPFDYLPVFWRFFIIFGFLQMYWAIRTHIVLAKWLKEFYNTNFMLKVKVVVTYLWFTRRVRTDIISHTESLSCELSNRAKSKQKQKDAYPWIFCTKVFT